MLSIARSRYALIVQLLFLLLNGVGVILSISFNASTPDLYEKNAHHKMGWIATWVMAAQLVMGLLLLHSGRTKEQAGQIEERASFLPMSLEAMAQHQLQQEEMNNFHWHRDSGQGTERASSSLHSFCGSPIDEGRGEEYDHFLKPETENETETERSSGRWNGPQRLLSNSKLGRYINRRLPSLCPQRLLPITRFAYDAIDRLILIFGFATVATGAVTYGGIMVSLEHGCESVS